MKSNNRGVTLVVLVVTFIVLLILAGVTISSVVGENGLIIQTKKAEKAYRKSYAREKLDLALAQYEISQGKEKLFNILNNIEGLQSIDPNDENSNPPYVVVIDGFEFLVNEYLNIEYQDEVNAIVPEIEKVEKKKVGEDVKILVTAKTEDLDGLDKIVLVKNGIEIEAIDAGGKRKVEEEFIIKGNGTYKIKAVGKNKRQATSEEIEVTEVLCNITGTLDAQTVVEGSLELIVKGQIKGGTITKVEIYDGETCIGTIPIEGDQTSIEERYTVYVPFTEYHVYKAKIISDSNESFTTNTKGRVNEDSINTKEDLKLLSTQVANGSTFENRTINVCRDFDASGITLTGSEEERYFEGTLNGKFHRIKNLTISSTLPWVGIFGGIGGSGVVKCLEFENVSVSGGSTKLAGVSVGVIAGVNYGKVKQIGIISGSVRGTATDSTDVGGIVGTNLEPAEIKYCYNKASVTASTAGYQVVGGICGHMDRYAWIDQCYNIGICSSSTRNVECWIRSVWLEIFI